MTANRQKVQQRAEIDTDPRPLFKNVMYNLDLSQTEVAEILGVTRSTISSILAGRLRVSAETAAECERSLGIPAEKLRPDVFRGLSRKA